MSNQDIDARLRSWDSDVIWTDQSEKDMLAFLYGKKVMADEHDAKRIVDFKLILNPGIASNDKARLYYTQALKRLCRILDIEGLNDVDSSHNGAIMERFRHQISGVETYRFLCLSLG
jgi:hypothetical protein